MTQEDANGLLLEDGAHGSEGKLSPGSLRRTMSEKLADLEAAEQAHLEDSRANVKGVVLAAMVYRSVGVIFGDLGTSPLYIFPSTFNCPPSRADALGALSLIFWTITLLALVKYVLIVLWANDNGEGGTISLYSLLCRTARIGFEYRTHRHDYSLARISTTAGLGRRSISMTSASKFKKVLEGSSALKRLLFVVVLLGTCAVIADGILTPGVSVLSAVEGLRVAVPSLPQEVVLIVSVAILVTLFSAQQYGTDAVGAAFAPILLLWLLSIAGVGIYNAIHYESFKVIAAVLPTHAVGFFARNGWNGWRMLGGILLCVTGTEALFADLGHFSVTAIQISFALIAYPCVLLQYMGQTAFLIHHPEKIDSTFWSSVPRPIFWPLFVVGTLAAIVASQALITGVFSIVNQLMALKCLPPLRVVHTSKSHHGQIFIPEVNYFIMALTVAVVLGFKNSTSLSSAYGVAVTMDMLTTTGLVTLVMVLVWRMPLVVALLFMLIFGAIEMAFFSATLLKVPRGGWFPLVVAVALSSLQYIWNWGERLKSVSNADRHVGPAAFFSPGKEELRLLWSDSDIVRVPGVAFFFCGPKPGLPPVLQHFVRNVPALHDVSVLVNVRYVPVSTVLPSERVLVSAIYGFSGLYRAVVRFGYNDLSDLGDGFAQEVIWNIYRICQEPQLPGDGSPAEVPFAPDSRESSSSNHRRQRTSDWESNFELRKASSDSLSPDGPPNIRRPSGEAPGSPLVQGIVGANLQRMSAQAVLQRRSLSFDGGTRLSPDLGRRSASATTPLLSRSSEQAKLHCAWPVGSLDHHRRHSWSDREIDVDTLTGLADATPRHAGAIPEDTTVPPSTLTLPASAIWQSESRDAARIRHARMQGVVYVAGRSNIHSRRDCPWIRRVLLDSVYVFMHNLFQEWAIAQKIPQHRLMEVGMAVEI